MEVIVFTGLLLLVGYAWMRQNERGLEQGKALTEMSGQALQASGYQLMSWGEEHRKGKTASPYPQKYEKEYTLDGIPFRSYIELQCPQKNRTGFAIASHRVRTSGPNTPSKNACVSLSDTRITTRTGSAKCVDVCNRAGMAPS